MSSLIIQNRKKSTHANFRLKPEDFDFIEKFSKETSLKKVQVIEALIHHLRSATEHAQKEIIKKYLTKNL